MKINAVRTSFESPWQNGVAERWVGSCRRELLEPCDCSERAASEAPAFRVRLLPSRGPHASWTRKGNPGCRTRRVTSGRGLPMIAWADCITVTIGRPRATAFPPILIYICAPFRRKRHGVEWLGPRARVRHPKQLLVKCRLKVQAWARNNPATFRGTTFGRGTGCIVACIQLGLRLN